MSSNDPFDIAISLIVRKHSINVLTYNQYMYSEKYGHIDYEEFEFKSDNMPYVYEGMDVAIHSRTKNGHIPMIDFKTNQQQDVFDLMDTLCLGGYVFNSGNSFHYYGDYLMPDAEWLKFMGDLLLYKIENIVDIRWIGHCLKRNSSALRISGTNKPAIKFVTKYVGLPF